MAKAASIGERLTLKRLWRMGRVVILKRMRRLGRRMLREVRRVGRSHSTMAAELKKVQGRSPNQKCRSIMFPKVRKWRQTIKATKQLNFHILEDRLFPKS